jgi:N-acetylglucosamine-6-sulfatase
MRFAADDRALGRFRGGFLLSKTMLMKIRWLVPAVVVLVFAVLQGTPNDPVRLSEASVHTPHPARTADATPARPNIVFVLTDDLSMDLLPYMPQVQAMEQRGLTFSDYFVSDSLCCPSRASTFTGNFPHDTGVFSNTGPDGGFQKFHDRGEEQRTFAVALQNAGYRTAMMGKYLNEYMQLPPSAGIPNTYVPPGWSEWDVAGWGYNEYDYNLNENGTLHYFGHRPSDYMTDVLADKATSFIDSSAAAHTPFFLETATFAPHFPYRPAPEDAGHFRDLRAPEPPNFDQLPTNAPRWLAAHGPLTAEQIKRINRDFRHRVEMVQAVDRLIGRVESRLAADGLADNTYLVFSSDNGLHTGEYRLMPGKLTPYDTDIHVPLVVVGPGVPAGATTPAVSENVDLAETFASIAGTNLSGDGHSLLPLFSGATPGDWRTAALVEHHGPDLRGSDPDFQQPASGNPRTYEAMRTRRFLYVEYDDGEREFYDLQTDPFELHNLAGQLSATTLAQLHEALLAMENCHSGTSCWVAMGGGLPDGLSIRIRRLQSERGVMGQRLRKRARRRHRQPVTLITRRSRN